MTGATILPFPQPDRRRERRDVLGRALLREQARRAARPAAFDAAVDAFALAVPPQAGRVDLAALRTLQESLFLAPGREPEMHRVWRETLATAAFASLIAAPLGLDLRVLTGAALLHRLDEVLFVAAVARAESTTQLRLRGPTLRRAYSERDAMLDGLFDAWDLDVRIVSAVRHWRSCLDNPAGEGGFPPSHGVYYAHLLAMTRLYPEDGTPGILGLAARELRVPATVNAVVTHAAQWTSATFSELCGL
jgi:hypothetical protein